MPGLSVTDEGHLVIEPGSDVLPETFMCLVFNPETWEDVPVHVYNLDVDAGKAIRFTYLTGGKLDNTHI